MERLQARQKLAATETEFSKNIYAAKGYFGLQWNIQTNNDLREGTVPLVVLKKLSCMHYLHY